MFALVSYLLQLLSAFGASDRSTCSERNPFFEFAARMIESNVERGQLTPSNASSAFIEQGSWLRVPADHEGLQGIFQNALREAIDATHNASQTKRWQGYLSTSIGNLAGNLTNSTMDSELPLDRFSVGSSMLLQTNATADASFLPATDALQESIALQPRNAEGGLWYYNNIANLSAYRGLSYLDGMYSYPLFAILSAANTSQESYDNTSASSCAACNDAYDQFRILYSHCGQPSGLLTHGYDATKNHSWANPVTGASPVVWGRALSWYTLGLLNVVQSPALQTCSPIIRTQLRQLLLDVLEPQLTAVEHSLASTDGAAFGVFQVVDRPAKPGNFVESSASFLSVYSLMRALKLGVVPEERVGRADVTELATGMFYLNYYAHVVDYGGNGTLGVEGTSTVASLRDDVVDYEYYVSRPVATNSLLGTSAFILAALEIARFEESR